MEHTSIIITAINSGLPAITVAALCITSAGVISSLNIYRGADHQQAEGNCRPR